MKKIFTFFLALVAGVGTMFAEKVQIGDLYYNLNETDKTAEVTYERGENKNNYKGLTTANIPASVTYSGTTYSVTSIGDWAFYNCSSLTSVTIPNSVTSIGKYAFESCSSLTKVNITDIAAWCNIAFTGIYSNPLYYAKHLFVNDVEVTDLVIPNSVTSIGNHAFHNCSGLTSVTIPNSVTSIGNHAFHNCSGLTSVTIPNSVTSIGYEAFSYCSSLTSVTIPNSVTSIEDYAFESCSGLTSVESPALLFNDAFEIFLLSDNEMPSQIKYLTINAGTLTEEGFDRIRASYRNLESVDLANAENTELSDEAFKGCYNLQTLRLPAGLKEIKYMAVAECVKLQAIDIPATVESIGDRAFEDCRSIQSITFGGAAGAPGRAASPAANSQLKKIGNWAFYNAHELQHLDIPEGVEEIGDGAFYGCTYLEDMVLPSSIRAIGDNCFALCGKLTKIVCNATTPPAIQAKTFYDVNRQIPVYVPDEAIASYESDEYWQEFDIQGASDIESAVSNMTNDSATAITKVMCDGQVLILRDGKTYTIQGVEVK